MNWSSANLLTKVEGMNSNISHKLFYLTHWPNKTNKCSALPQSYTFNASSIFDDYLMSLCIWTKMIISSPGFPISNFPNAFSYIHQNIRVESRCGFNILVWFLLLCCWGFFNFHFNIANYVQAKKKSIFCKKSGLEFPKFMTFCPQQQDESRYVCCFRKISCSTLPLLALF